MTQALKGISAVSLRPEAPPACEDREVRDLLALASRKTRHGRADLFNAISDLFERRGDTLQEGERQLMLEILRRLSQEVERSVRASLARRVAGNPALPAGLATLLASDDIEVAYPILVESAVLRDPDLIEIIRHRSMQHRLAVSVRPGLGEAVSAALVECGEEDVIVSLLSNTTARIGQDVMQHLVEESRRTDRYRQPLVSRDDLPRELARRMCAWVSAALRHHIVRHYEIDVHDLDDQLSGVVGEVGGQTDAEAAAESAAARLIDKLHGAGELTARFAVKALGQGQTTLFELTLAKLADLRPTLVRRIAYEPGGEALAVACRAIDVDPAAFLTIFKLTRKARGVGEELDQVGLRRLGRLYEQTSREAAEVVLRSWRRDKDYLAALRTLEGFTGA
jgi:uncharacterized protein (DUF2336 family)